MKANPNNENQDIIDFMQGLGFVRRENMEFTHPYFTRDVVFDVSASGTRPEQIMSHIFKRVISYGEDKKTAEIRNVLDIW